MDNMFHFWLRLQRMTQQFVFFVFCFATLLRFEIFETGQKRVKVKHRQILFLDRVFPRVKKLSILIFATWVRIYGCLGRFSFFFFNSIESKHSFLQYLAHAFTARCICEIPCLSIRWVQFLNTVHELSSNERNITERKSTSRVLNPGLLGEKRERYL